jgi:hypothetical protein
MAVTDAGNPENWREAAEFLRGLVLTGHLWKLPRARIEALILGLIETAEAAREALERRDGGDGGVERPAVH